MKAHAQAHVFCNNFIMISNTIKKSCILQTNVQYLDDSHLQVGRFIVELTTHINVR